MINKKKILCVIPARSGSKGLKNKNILEFNNYPLVSWPINAANKSKYIDRVVVSTDSKKIKIIAEKSGAEVPFLRPKKFSKDTSTSFSVIKHALAFFAKQNINFDLIVMLEPTSPLTTYKDIDKAILKLIGNKIATSIVGVSLVENAHPDFLCSINSKGFIDPYNKKKFIFKRRQNLNKLYFFEGSLYISEINSLLLNKTFYHDKTLPYVVPKWQSLEIDDIYDLISMKAISNYKKI